VALNIKTEEAHELARALAEETGETLTDAVTEALRDRLARVLAARRQRRTRVEDVLAIGRRCAATLTGPAVDHGQLLYDERGLPR
jgi:antitoxin VapB